jgi:integrase
MARIIGKLTALKVGRASKPGMYADGGGLYLQITPGGKSWIYRFMLRGRSREMGLGSVGAIKLTDARKRAAECRQLCHDGVDPIEARYAARAQAKLDEAKALTFKSAATAYIALHRAGWRNEKHAAQWESTLETYAYPMLGSLSVQAIDTGLVLKVLEQIWTDKPETASRLRGRIEAILDWATAREYRTGDNPARWRGHLDKTLPARSKVRAIKHHAALPYAELPDFMIAQRGQASIAARALEFTILTAARTGETIGATADEFNLSEKVWTIPAERMKARQQHRVPLSDRALAIVREMLAVREEGQQFLFPGRKAAKPLSNMAMTAVLRRMKRGNLTVHGFRSTFRDWAAERTSYPRDVVEMALAHAIADKTEAAYRRGDLFEKRRRLMAEWAKYASAPTATTRNTVVPLRAGTR